MKSPITTHVLDTMMGKPAAGISVRLEIQNSLGEWKQLASGATSSDGRIADLLSEGSALQLGTYRLTFDTAQYFRSSGIKGFYPYVHVVFEVHDAAAHYHVPLLLSPFGYSTYRGS